MARKGEPQALPGASRYMTLQQVATELGFKSRGSIYNLIYTGQLDAIAAGTTGRGLRVTRTSFDAYCVRKEAEGVKRFKTAS